MESRSMQLKICIKILKSNMEFIVFTWMFSYNESINSSAQENEKCFNNENGCKKMYASRKYEKSQWVSIRRSMKQNNK